MAAVALVSRIVHPFRRFASTSSPKSVDHFLKSVAQRLEAGQVPEAKDSAAHLLAGILGTRSVEEVHSSRSAERVLDDGEITRLEAMVQCRLARMPVQYILKEWDFRDLTLTVRPPVFIPR